MASSCTPWTVARPGAVKPAEQQTTLRVCAPLATTFGSWGEGWKKAFCFAIIMPALAGNLTSPTHLRRSSTSTSAERVDGSLEPREQSCGPTMADKHGSGKKVPQKTTLCVCFLYPRIGVGQVEIG